MGGGSSSINVQCVTLQEEDSVLSNLLIQQQKAENIIDKNTIQKNGDILNLQFKPYTISYTRGVVGLDNIGNTCFFNVAIQCLSHTQPLSDFFNSSLYQKEINKSNKQGSQGQITCFLADLIKELWSRKRAIKLVEQNNKRAEPKILNKYLTPDKLFQAIIDKKKMFGEGEQEDCQELLAVLLDLIHEDLNQSTQSVAPKQYINVQIDEKLAQESWKYYLQSSRSLIVDIFQGQLSSSLICSKCDYTLHQFEPFMYLSLPLMQGKQNIQACIQEFIKCETMTDIKCTKCSQNSLQKHVQIWQLPAVLIIQFKRFQISKGRAVKNSQFVDFPVDNLDLSHYVIGSDSDNSIFNLYSCIHHYGQFNNGHYVSFSQNQDDLKWYAYNDKQILAVNQVRQLIVCKEAYILFYQKNTNSLIKRQKPDDPSSWNYFQEVKKKVKSQLSQSMIVEKHRKDLNDLEKADISKLLVQPKQTNQMFLDDANKSDQKQRRNKQ